MASEPEQKIRRVAIVLQSMDSATARRVLSQLPDSVARNVRRSMANLGPVSASERAAAMEELQSLMSIAPSSSGLHRSEVASASPAAQVLAAAGGVHDSVQLSQDALQAANQSAAPTWTGMQVPPGTEPSHAPWMNIPPDLLAQLLELERAIVIAAVIHELPVIMATAVLQHLPVAVATEAMAILPGLHRNDPTLLAELLEQMRIKVEERLKAEQRDQSGLDKLKAIVARVPQEQRSVWASALGNVAPQLNKTLGWENVPSSIQAAAGPASVPPRDAEPVILPFVPKEPVAVPTPIRPKAFSNWRDVMRLQDADFVAVLHSVDAKDVLLALSNADRTVMLRVERLVPKKDVARLRKKIAELQEVSLREIDAACERIFDKAEHMFRDSQATLIAAA